MDFKSTCLPKMNFRKKVSRLNEKTRETKLIFDNMKELCSLNLKKWEMGEQRTRKQASFCSLVERFSEIGEQTASRTHPIRI